VRRLLKNDCNEEWKNTPSWRLVGHHHPAVFVHNAGLLLCFSRRLVGNLLQSRSTSATFEDVSSCGRIVVDNKLERE
jgi:hypothetical protein